MKMILDEHYLQKGQDVKSFLKLPSVKKWTLKRPFLARGILLKISACWAIYRV